MATRLNLFCVRVFLLTVCSLVSARLSPNSYGSNDFIADASRAVISVLRTVSEPSTSVIFIADSTVSVQSLSKIVWQSKAPWGVGVFQATMDTNVTQHELLQVVAQARKERLLSWNVCVVVLSEDPKFLDAFAEASLKGRLLVWATKLLVVTSLSLNTLRPLLSLHWTFSMMNAHFLILEGELLVQRWGIYSYLPYTPNGPQLVRLATWTSTFGLRLSFRSLFPEKFSNFHGAVLNVTALPFPPYWSVLEDPSASTPGKYSGTDYLLLDATARALNFTFRVVHTDTWTEVADRVVERVAFLSPIFHNVLPARLERYEFSFVYEYGSLDFSLKKPGLKPQWQSLYYPLSHQVWLMILATLIVMPVAFYLVNLAGRFSLQKKEDGREKRLSLTMAIQQTVAALLGQDLWRGFYARDSTRLLAGVWLLFSLVLGTAYRGNLTASLTLPVYPARPETLVDLVQAVDRITMPTYGSEFKAFFGKSDSPVFRKLSDLMHIVPSVDEGQRQAIQYNQAHLDTRRYQLLNIAQKFTRSDGTSSLYIGRESIIPGQSAWPLPHDAPYRRHVDRCIMAVIEAGLYEEWSNKVLREARRESSRRVRKEQSALPEEQVHDKELETGNSGVVKALTVVHMQGPLMLLVLGIGVAMVIFIFECVMPTS